MKMKYKIKLKINMKLKIKMNFKMKIKNENQKEIQNENHFIARKIILLRGKCGKNYRLPKIYYLSPNFWANACKIGRSFFKYSSIRKKKKRKTA